MDAGVTEGASRQLIRSFRHALKLIWFGADAYARRMLVLSFALLISFSVTSALIPVVFKLLLDAFAAKPVAAVGSGAMVLLTLYLLCQLVFHVSSDVRGFVHGAGAQRLSRRIIVRVFGHIVRLPMSFHVRNPVGGILQTLSQGLSGCHTLLQHLVFTFLPVAIEFVTITIVLVHFDHPRYLAILGAAALSYVWIYWRGATEVVEPSREISDANIQAGAAATESLLNTEAVKHFSAERQVCGEYDDALKDVEKGWRGLLGVQTRYALAATGVFLGSLSVALILAAYEVLHGSMGIGDFVLISGYVARLVQPLEAIGLALRDVSQAVVFLRRMIDVLDEKPEPDDPSVSAEIGVAHGELRFEGVSFAYTPDRHVLKNVSLTVPAGTALGIVGLSGSGKTTLVRLLLRLYEPLAGRILLDGRPISDFSLTDLRSAIAVVPQEPALFGATLRRNVTFGSPDATQEELDAAMEAASLQRLLRALPQGYDTLVGERGMTLSGGERQRISIARAALRKPRIFLFDEATSSLDSTTEAEILGNLKAISQGCTTLIIAHRLSTVMHADQIIVLDHGVVAERGTHRELLARDGAYASLWHAQQMRRPQPAQAATADT